MFKFITEATSVVKTSMRHSEVLRTAVRRGERAADAAAGDHNVLCCGVESSPNKLRLCPPYAFAQTTKFDLGNKRMNPEIKAT